MKKSILFIIPGIAGRFDRRWEKRLKLQERNEVIRDFFRVAKRHERSKGFPQTLMRYFKVTESAPWAYFGIRGEGLQIRSMDWFKISLINQEKFINFDPKFISNLAKDFANDFNYAEDAIVTSEGNWYMSLGKHRRVRSTPLPIIWDYYHENPNWRTYGLSGADAPIWINRFKDAQEWLRSYLDNSGNESLTKLMWPWGTRETMQIQGTPKFSAIFSDNAMFRGLGEYLGLSFFKQSYILADLTQMIENHPQMCVLDLSLFETLSNGTFQAWNSAREHFINTYLGPVMDALHDNLIDEIIIDDVMGNVYVYDKKFRIPLRRGSITYYYKD